MNNNDVAFLAQMFENLTPAARKFYLRTFFFIPLLPEDLPEKWKEFEYERTRTMQVIDSLSSSFKHLCEAALLRGRK